jgi:hypothetical protein
LFIYDDGSSWNILASYLSTGSYKPIVFNTGNAERMRLDTSGNLGIGQPSPIVKLDIKGGNGNQAIFNNAGERFTQVTWQNNGSNKGSIWVDNTTSLFELYGYSGVGMTFSTSGTERMRLNTSGNLGIGTTTPQRLLDARGAVNLSTTAPTVAAIGYADIHLRTFSGATNSPAKITVVDNWFDSYSTFTDGFRWFNWSSDGVAAERMRITSAGLFQFNSGYGSVATAYGCRAWANVYGGRDYGTGINSSGNGSSFVRNSTGNYTFNFVTAMPDVNYSAVAAQESGSLTLDCILVPYTYTTAFLQLISTNSGSTSDFRLGSIAIFR